MVNSTTMKTGVPLALAIPALLWAVLFVWMVIKLALAKEGTEDARGFHAVQRKS